MAESANVANECLFILRLGSTCSLQISEAMPPRKKLKASVQSGVSRKRESGDWRTSNKSLQDRLRYVQKNSILSDVKLVVGEEGTVFHCHRLILAFVSPVFEAMFFGDLAETGDTVTIPDVDPVGFQHLIRFCYTDEFNMPNAATAFKTYFAADKYCMAVLKELCEDYLYNCSVTPSNVWLFFENALFLNSEAIRESCLCVLSHHLKSALEQSSFLNINLHTMESLLSLDAASAPEETLLRSMIRWAEHKAASSSLSLESVLKPLLSHIRLGALTAKEFADVRCSTRLKEVVSKDDSLTILEHLLNPSLCQLPDWCCRKGKRRVPLKPKAAKKRRSPSFSSLSSLTTTSSDGSTSSTDDDSDLSI